MGRFLPTATMQVYQFEQEWVQFCQAPRKVTREAFGELVAMAHFQAAAIAHAGSPYTFEMILLAMLVGIVRRVEKLTAQEPTLFSRATAEHARLQTNLCVIMNVLRQRLLKQKRELFSFARALRQEDQSALRTLLAAARSNAGLVRQDANMLSDEMLLAALVESMCWICQLEKQHTCKEASVSLSEWNRLCAV
jgi:hypothetical protein